MGDKLKDAIEALADKAKKKIQGTTRKIMNKKILDGSVCKGWDIVFSGKEK